MENKSLKEGQGKASSGVRQIIKALNNMIIEQNLHIGDKIPNENELSAMFGKSRSCIREAVKILDAYGVLEVRRGDGTYVRGSASSGVFDAQFFRNITMGTKMPDLMQLRQILESGIICSAISVIGSEDLAKIRCENENLQSLIRMAAPIEDIVAADMGFHMQIAYSLHNDILTNVYENMMDLFNPFITFSYLQQRAANDFSVEKKHELILRAIEEADYDLARYAIRSSLKDWEALNKKYHDSENSLRFYSSECKHVIEHSGKKGH